VGAGEIEQRLDRLFRLQTHDFSAQVPRPLLVFQKVSLCFGVDALWGLALRPDMDGVPISVKATR
jgi:hypothetical protein